MRLRTVGVVLGLALAGQVNSGSVVVAPYVTTAGDLVVAAGQVDPAMPLAVAVGRGYKAAPVRVELRCMTSDSRSDWWDNHSGPECVTVLVLVETTRAEVVAP